MWYTGHVTPLLKYWMSISSLSIALDTFLVVTFLPLTILVEVDEEEKLEGPPIEELELMELK